MPCVWLHEDELRMRLPAEPDNVEAALTDMSEAIRADSTIMVDDNPSSETFPCEVTMTAPDRERLGIVTSQVARTLRQNPVATTRWRQACIEAVLARADEIACGRDASDGWRQDSRLPDDALSMASDCVEHHDERVSAGLQSIARKAFDLLLHMPRWDDSWSDDPVARICSRRREQRLLEVTMEATRLTGVTQNSNYARHRGTWAMDILVTTSVLIATINEIVSEIDGRSE